MNVFLDLCLFFQDFFTVTIIFYIYVVMGSSMYTLPARKSVDRNKVVHYYQRLNKRFYKINSLRLARKRVLYGLEYDQYTRQSKTATCSRHPAITAKYTRYCQRQTMSVHTYAFYFKIYIQVIENARVFNYLKMIRVRDTKYFFVG